MGFRMSDEAYRKATGRAPLSRAQQRTAEERNRRFDKRPVVACVLCGQRGRLGGLVIEPGYAWGLGDGWPYAETARPEKATEWLTRPSDGREFPVFPGTACVCKRGHDVVEETVVRIMADAPEPGEEGKQGGGLARLPRFRRLVRGETQRRRD